MKRRHINSNNGRRFYRDKRRGWLGGVCAGLANYWGMPVFIVRLLALLALCSPLLPFLVIAYVIMSITVPAEPDDLYPSPEARNFYQAAHREPMTTIGQVRHQMRTLEQRLRKLETYVTSTEFEFDQGLRERR